MAEKLLTIGIPTLNGGDKLIQAITSVKESIAKIGIDHIDILVVDNCSDIDTKKVLKNANLDGDIYLKEHRERLSYDCNVLSIFKISQSKFIKLLADDDVVSSESIGEMLQLIQGYPDVDVIQQEFYVFQEDEKMELFTQNKTSLNFRYFEKDTASLEYSNFRHGQVSSLLFRKNSFLNMVEPYMLESNYIHANVFIKLCKFGNVIVSNSPTIYVRTGSPNFSNNSKLSFETVLAGCRSYFLIFRKYHYTRDIKYMYLQKILNYTLDTAIQLSLKDLRLNLKQISIITKLMLSIRLKEIRKIVTLMILTMAPRNLIDYLSKIRHGVM